MADTRYTREYHCTGCGKETARDKLTVKKAVFTSMGSRARTFKSRVTRQICPACLAKDADWNREPYSEPEFEALPESMKDDSPAEEGDGSVQMELPLEPAHLMQASEDFRDSEGRPPGHPQYCGEGCIHVEAPASR